MAANFAEARVTAKQELARSVYGFSLTPTDGALKPFEPGAHLELLLPGGRVRHYSITNGPGDMEAYKIAVLREEAGRGGSRRMCDAIEEGDVLQISEPRNNFRLDPNKDHYMLLAGGIGVTPILSMAKHLAARNASFQLHYCARERARAAFLDELAAPELQERAQLHFDDEAEGYLDLKSLFSTPQEETQIYLCGPAGFMAAVEEAAAHWPLGSLRKEVFAAEPAPIDDADAGSFTVELARAGVAFSVAAEQTILEAAEKAGVSLIDSSCREGLCGTCIQPVLSGDIIHRDQCLYDDEREAGDQIACCVSRAKPGSTLILDI